MMIPELTLPSAVKKRKYLCLQDFVAVMLLPIATKCYQCHYYDCLNADHERSPHPRRSEQVSQSNPLPRSLTNNVSSCADFLSYISTVAQSLIEDPVLRCIAIPIDTNSPSHQCPSRKECYSFSVLDILIAVSVSQQSAQP